MDIRFVRRNGEVRWIQTRSAAFRRRGESTAVLVLARDITEVKRQTDALRENDERFLRGQGEYVADIRIPGTREIAFVRSPVAHARLRRVVVPDEFRNVVFTAGHLTGVKPISSTPTIRGFKSSAGPILAHDKLRFVGEIVAMCMAATRAEAEDIASRVSIEYDELPAVTDQPVRRTTNDLINVFFRILTNWVKDNCQTFKLRAGQGDCSGSRDRRDLGAAASQKDDPGAQNRKRCAMRTSHGETNLLCTKDRQVCSGFRTQIPS